MRKKPKRSATEHTVSVPTATRLSFPNLPNLEEEGRKEMNDFLLKCGIDGSIQEELNAKIMKHKDDKYFMVAVSRLRRTIHSIQIATMEEEEVPESLVDILFSLIADILAWEEL